MATKKSIGVISLGCDKNRVDTEKMLSLLKTRHELVKDIENTFNVIYKRNKQAGKNNNLLIKEQQEMTKFLKEIGVVNHYQLAYEYFEELKQMQQLGKSNQEIITYCISIDSTFVFSDFYNRFVAYKERNGHLNITLVVCRYNNDVI